MKKSVVVVVGGSGFVGTRLCQKLHGDGVPFRIIDKVPSAVFPEYCALADIRSIDALREAMPEGAICINLAAEHRDDVEPKSLYQAVNVDGARNLCQVAREKGVSRIVFTSSVACYGFAPPNTGEDGAIAPFNEYGRTKYEAEEVYRAWWNESPEERHLFIVRPTVIFGEQNRGNVYNLLKQIASGFFVMIGSGRNVKSMAYVGNVAALLEFALGVPQRQVLVNYVDEPQMDMNTLVALARSELGKGGAISFRLPVAVGMGLGMIADFFAKIFRRKYPISAIRVRKFIKDSQFSTSVSTLGFVAPYPLVTALKATIEHEFKRKDNSDDILFYSE